MKKLTLLAACACLMSCESTAINQDRLAKIGDIALSYAEKKGKISAEDAALAREAGKILLPPQTIEVTAAK